MRTAILRLTLSYRNTEKMTAKRRVQLTSGTIREWCRKFDRFYVAQLQNRQAGIRSKRHLDKVLIKMNGVSHDLWRAVERNGATIDIPMQPKRDRWTALRFFRKLLHTAERAPRVIVTDKLRS